MYDNYNHESCKFRDGSLLQLFHYSTKPDDFVMEQKEKRWIETEKTVNEMKSETLKRYVAFLRGINVGGHHKVPMADLAKEMKHLHFDNVVTLLNSGNIIFDSLNANTEKIEKMISEHLEQKFGFPIPTIIRTAETIEALFKFDPFHNITVTRDIRLYVSFLKQKAEPGPELPWTSEDQSYTILDVKEGTIISVLDLSISQTPKAMDALEKFFGKDITTRNWNTIERIVKKI